MSATPPDSRPGSPVSKVSRRQLHGEDGEPRKQDKAYKRYAAGIERALASFEPSSRVEWPDYISFLGRLFKAVQTHPGGSYNLPHKSEVASRLSQCMKPTLPSGVHQKALDVYACIFELIGTQRLGNNLQIFLPGLSGVLGFASLSLRPAFLSLMEAHILPVNGEQLRPALKALILSLLPGLEEENGEDFDRCLSILDTLRAFTTLTMNGQAGSKASPSNENFWQCFFLACIGSASRRQGALAFLARRLPKLVPEQGLPSANLSEHALSHEADAVVSPEPGLLIRCFVAGLEDDQVLVQRGFLDLLLTHLPLHSPVLVARASKHDVVRLVTAAISVVARKDMSLNRRLWSWFVGPQASNEDEGKTSAHSPTLSRAQPQDHSSQMTDYLYQYAHDVLAKAVLRMLSERPTKPSARAKPFRVCLSLLDRSDIGGVIVPQIVLPALLNIHDYAETASSEDFKEVLRSATGLFEGVEGSTILGQIANLGYEGLTASSLQRRRRAVELAQFILDRLNVRDDEVIIAHVPRVILLLLSVMNQGQIDAPTETQKDSDYSRYEPIETLLETLVECLPTMTFERDGSGSEEAMTQQSPDDTSSDDDLIDTLSKAYDMGHLTSVSLSSNGTSLALLRHSRQLLVRILEEKSPTSHRRVTRCSRIFASILAKFQFPPQHMVVELAAAFETYLRQRPAMPTEEVDQAFTAPFEVLHAMLSVIVTIARNDENGIWRRNIAFLGLVERLVQGFWSNLSPLRPRYHVEAVHCLWQLQDLLGEGHSVEASITSLVSQGTSRDHESLSVVQHARRFAILWNHTTARSAQAGKRPSAMRLPSSQAIGFHAGSRTLSDYQQNLHQPLFLLFDISDDNPELFDFLHTWLQRPSIASRVFSVLLERIVKAHKTMSGDAKEQPDLEDGPFSAHADRTPECLYYLRRISKLLGSNTARIWTALEDKYRPNVPSEMDRDDQSIIEVLGHTCTDILEDQSSASTSSGSTCRQSVTLTCLSILQTCCNSSKSAALMPLKLETFTTAMLRRQLRGSTVDASIQAALLETTLAALKVRGSSQYYEGPGTKTDPSGSSENVRDIGRTLSRQPARSDSYAGQVTAPLDAETASQLIQCLQEGIEATSSACNLEHWIQFMIEALQFLALALFQSAIPLVETLCKRIRHISQDMESTFLTSGSDIEAAPESGLIALLNGLQYLLTMAHDQLSFEESRSAHSRTPEPAQSFFGNVAGVFSADTPKLRKTTGNTRLTVILCFQDAFRVCLPIWSWGAYGGIKSAPDPTCLASFAYISQRLRNQTRKMLDRMFSVEGLECLETLITAWVHRSIGSEKSDISPTISLLHALDSCSPKQTMPVLFNSIYSRTSPSSIDTSRQSTLTSEISDIDLARFLIDYTKSLDDDAMDEIWTDCTTFLRDVLSNPLPHSKILPLLLHFLVMLAQKVDRTNFGEQRKMRKDLADLFIRLLGAVFTTRGAGAQLEADPTEVNQAVDDPAPRGRASKRRPRSTEVLQTISEIIPRLTIVLQDTERIASAVSTIASNLTTPLIHSKTFPENTRADYLLILERLSDLPPAAARPMRKDLLDVFAHTRLFLASSSLAMKHLVPLTRSLSLTEKDALPSLLSRLNPPTTAGIMFGVGATAARTESDRKTQLALRRASLLIQSADLDFAATHVALLEEKLADLLLATPASSPSSTTRAEVFMLLRALVLRTSAIHIASLWPLITLELQKALGSALPSSTEWETYNVPSLLQACNLLDCLLLVAPDEFQMLEWLFVTDGIEAVYRPGVSTTAASGDSQSVALCDELAEDLNSVGLGADGDALVPETPADELSNLAMSPVRSGDKTITTKSTEDEDLLAEDSTVSDSRITEAQELKKPLLRIPQSELENLTTTPKAEFVGRILRPWFARLSMHAYECAYAMRPADIEGLKQGVIEDLFDGGRGIVG